MAQGLFYTKNRSIKVYRFYKKNQIFTGDNSSELKFTDADVKPQDCVEHVFELLPDGHPKKIGVKKVEPVKVAEPVVSKSSENKSNSKK